MTLATALLGAALAAAPAQLGQSGPGAPVTLLGAGALGPGGAAWLTSVGYPQLTLTYAQGISDWDDLGATVGVGWTTGEMLLAAVWRRELAGDAGSRAGFRLVAGPWFNFGATWIHPLNDQANLGLSVAPGFAWTATAGTGLVSVFLDAGLVWAWQRGMGLAFQPRLGVSYEVPVVKDVTLGASAGIWSRWASGSAGIPGVDRTLQGQLDAVVTWKVF
jgi:hypothetical protein